MRSRRSRPAGKGGRREQRDATSGRVSVLDRPNSYIGRSVPRPNARRLLHGRGQFVDDIVLPRMAHVAFWRSPFAHARIKAIERDAAARSPGVIRVVTGAEIAEICKPWVGVLAHLQGIKSAPQYPLAMERACWQGEAVAAVVASTRRAAEDALERLTVELEELPAVTDMASALDPATPVIHPELGDNLTFERKLEVGDVDGAFERAAAVVEHSFRFGRHTGVTLEPRAILADYDPAEHRLTIYHSFQAPHMMQDIVARHLDVPAANVRVICRDVGGSFGIKVHIYPDEMATVALSMLLRRPVKFVADRLESFVSDIHARDHRVKGRMALNADGEITAVEIDDLTGIGPYSVYPRTSGIEANQVVNLTGAPYRHQCYRARARVVLQNKNVMCQYRAVGHPIAIAVTEALVDAGARALEMDPAEVRRRNLIPDDAYPHANPWGIRFERLSHHRALARLLEMMDYEGLRAEQARLRAARHLSRHRACRVRRGDQPERCLLRRRRRPDLGAGRHHDAARCQRRARRPDQRHRAGPGHRGGHGAGRGERVRGAAGAGQGDLRRHRQHALWRRHLGIASRRHWRRGDAAGRRCATPPTCSRWLAPCCRHHRKASTSKRARSSISTVAASACRSKSWRASSTSDPTPCPKGSGPSWSPRVTSCRGSIPSRSPTASRARISRSTP